MSSWRFFHRVSALVLAAAFVARASVGDCQDVDPLRVDLLHRQTLSDDWGGLRGWLEHQGIGLEILYTGDVISNLSGGKRTDTTYLDNLDMTLTWHMPKLLDINPGTIFLYGLFNHGGDPSSFVGDAQGVDNIEAPDSAKLYEAWWQKTLLDDHVSLLAGLYDLSSEFDVVESAALFIHSSFGTGPGIGLSGINGPSIFPTTSVGVRLRAVLGGFVWQTAVLDGVPGDPNDDRGTHICLDKDDGLLIASEAMLVRYETEGAEVPMMRSQPHHIGRGWNEPPYAWKLAVGAWGYTAKQPLIASEDPTAPAKGHAHPGLYVLADVNVSAWDPLDAHGLALFARAGIADGDVERFAGYVGGGIVYDGLLPPRWKDQLGFGIAAARNGRGFERASKKDGQEATEFEIAIEWTYRLYPTPWLALQPDLQCVIHPGGIVGRDTAVVAGIRYEVRF